MRKAIEDLKELSIKAGLLNPSKPVFLDQHIQLSKSALGILLDFVEKAGIESVSKGLVKAKKMKEQPWSELRQSEKAMVIYELKEGLDLGIEELEYKDKLDNGFVDDRS